MFRLRSATGIRPPSFRQHSESIPLVEKSPSTPWTKILWAGASLIIISLMISLIIQSSRQNNQDSLKYQREQYTAITPIAEGWFILMRNDSFGYADRDTQEVIPLQYEAAYPFIDGLARVQKAGKYGWINKDGIEVIPAQYDDATDFKDGLATVNLDEQEFQINSEGKRITVSENEEEKKPVISPTDLVNSSPTYAHLTTVTSKALGEIMENTGKIFDVQLKNTGKAKAQRIRIRTSDNRLRCLTQDGFDLTPNESLNIQFEISNDFPIGSLRETITISAENIDERRNISVTAQIKNQPEPAPALRQVTCNLGRVNCQVRFFDPIQGKQISFSTNSNGEGSYTIAQSIFGQTLDINFTCDGKSQTIRIRIHNDGSFQLP